ncbi:MAG TPA: hypothetical protein VEH76_05135, partial [Methylocystis sp.]|nr:hypothetical protein [Methylocystis sp.]
LRSERIQSAVRRMRDAFENQIDCDNGIECIQSLLENHRGAESGPLSLELWRELGDDGVRQAA